MAGIDELLAQITQGGGNIDMSKLQGLVGPVMEQIQAGGGLNALLEKLKAAGFSDQVSSWLSAGSNLPVDPSAIGQALGVDKIAAMAKESGLSIDQVQTGISEMLPGLVDKMSPTGSLPTSPQDLTAMLGQLPGGDQLSSMLGGLLGGGK